MYDNSGAYDEYLRARYVPETVNRLGVQMKLTHSIVPPRHGVALKAPFSALPDFKTNDEWYQAVYLSRHTYHIRFQEFSLRNA